MGHGLARCIVFIFLKMHYLKWKKIFILIFILHFIFFAEGSCDDFKTDVVLLIASMIIVKYFRKKVFKNKLTRVYIYLETKALSH